MGALIGITLANAAFATDRCVLRRSGSEREISDGRRRIVLVGWRHLDNAEMEIAEDGWADAANNAAFGQCELIIPATQKRLDRLAPNLASSKHVLRRLHTLLWDNTMSTIAVELTPAEDAARRERASLIDYQRHNITNLCNMDFKTVFEPLRVLYPGPVLTLVERLDHPVTIFPAESAVAKAGGLEALGRMERAMTALKGHDGPLGSLTAETAVAAISRGLDRLDFPGPDDIHRATALIADPRLGKLYDALLMARLDLRKNIIVRDQAIARALWSRGGSLVMLIGNDHLDDLADKIMDHCHREPSS